MREEHGAVDRADPREGRAPVGSDACAYTSYGDGEAPDEYPKTGAGTEGVARDVWNALYEVQDPEMPVSVVDLGLIYDVEVEDADGDGAGDGREGTTVTVEMTLTYTGCPARDVLTNDVRCAAETVPEVASAEVDLRYSPEWNVNMVTDRGRADLREFGLSV
ncbi:1,2-phenylacetyl-CoA epoxidase subunit PaaD [Haloparvum sp. AD34]